MDTVTNLRTFLAVVQHHGFSEAARQLHVVPSVVAKRVAQLEKTFGARLFERSTRAVSLTAAGERLRAHALSAVDGFDGLVAAVRRDEDKPEGHIRLMAPTTLTTLHLGAVLTAFLAQHERITLDVTLADRSINPLEQAYDMVISGRSAHYEGVQEIPLAPIDYVLCAAPAYLQAQGGPGHPGELATHQTLVFRPAGMNWTFRSARGPVFVDIAPRLLADDNRTVLLAAQQGLGIALLPGYVVREALAEGRLHRVLPDYPPQEAWFKAYVPRRLRHASRIEALCDWVAKAMKQL